MKGMSTTFRCQLCGKLVEEECALNVKVGLPTGWTTRDRSLGAEVMKLYPGWRGTTGPDILPRLFCSQMHMEVFSTVERDAAKLAHADALLLAQKQFAKIMRTAKLKAMDAVTALATAVYDEDEDEDAAN